MTRQRIYLSGLNFPRLPFTDSMHALLVQRDPRKRDCSSTTRDRQPALKQQPGSKSAASAAHQGKRISNVPFRAAWRKLKALPRELDRAAKFFEKPQDKEARTLEISRILLFHLLSFRKPLVNRVFSRYFLDNRVKTF